MTATKKTAIAAGVLLLLAGTATVVVLQSARIRTQATPASASADASAQPAGSARPGIHPVSTTVRTGVMDSPEAAALAVKYGDDRTKKARALALDGLGFARDVLEVGSTGKETAADEVKAQLGPLYDELQLTPAQEAQAFAILEKATAAAMDAMKNGISRAEADPTGIMALILASDAVADGEMDAGEFHKLAAPADEATRLALHFPGAWFGLQSAARQQEYRGSLLAILDPAQAEILKREPAKEDPPAVNPPAIGLEDRERGLSAVRKLFQASRELEEFGK